MVLTYRQPAIPKFSQMLADRAFMHADAERLLELVTQVEPPPADHLVRSGLRTRLDQRHQRPALRLRQLRWVPCRLSILQARKACGMITVNPIAQGLTIHPAQPRRCRPSRPLQNQRQRQYPPSRTCALRTSRRLPKLKGRQGGFKFQVQRLI